MATILARSVKLPVARNRGVNPDELVDSTVARMSGVTARTLRYYDEIDLLHPARVGENGYRYYESVQMLRLQPAACLRDAMIAHARARMR